MADKHPRETSTTTPQQAHQETAPLAESGETPALRHVGKTLEADPAYFGVFEKGRPTLEAQVLADFRQEQAGSIETDGRRGETPEPEPLKTRLPGDTSSDPHTDLGPDTAATLRNR